MLKQFLGISWKRYPNLVRFKALYPKRSITKGYKAAVKRRIQHHLNTEDYRCRLPDAKHPLIKHKLRRTIHPFKIAEWVWQ